MSSHLIKTMTKLKAKENSIEVFERDDQFWTTSLDVAEKFGKMHKDVLKAIRNLECPEEFKRRNFAPRDYRDDRGKDQKSYLISRDGFTLLAMGFTGKGAPFSVFIVFERSGFNLECSSFPPP
jgi:anti-repressor protein